MKDPFDKPYSFKPSAANKVAMRAVVGALPENAVVLFASPATWPTDIDGARDDLARCTKCLAKVWLSPSSVAVLNHGAVVVCVPCIVKQIRV